MVDGGTSQSCWKVLRSYSVGTSPINTVTAPSQQRQNSITMPITPAIPDILRPAHVAAMNAGWRFSSSRRQSFYFFASRVLGEQNEEQATLIRQVSHPKVATRRAKYLQSTPWCPVDVQVQTSQLDGSVDEVIVVVVQDISTAFLCKSLF